MLKKETASQCLLHADLHLQVEVVPDLLPDRAHDLEDEPRAILERAAVIVLPIVDRRAEELRDEVAVGAVQLDAVESRLARSTRAFGEGIHRGADLVDRHRLALEAVDGVRLRRSS